MHLWQCNNSNGNEGVPFRCCRNTRQYHMCHSLPQPLCTTIHFISNRFEINKWTFNASPMIEFTFLLRATHKLRIFCGELKTKLNNFNEINSIFRSIQRTIANPFWHYLLHRFEWNDDGEWEREKIVFQFIRSVGNDEIRGRHQSTRFIDWVWWSEIAYSMESWMLNSNTSAVDGWMWMRSRLKIVNNFFHLIEHYRCSSRWRTTNNGNWLLRDKENASVSFSFYPNPNLHLRVTPLFASQKE